jgi:hypothetical protein
MYGLKSDDYISKELNRPKASVQRMAEAIFPPVERSGPWTEDELERMKRYLGVCEVETIARIFGRAIADIEARIRELDSNKVDREWTLEEIADLKRLYGTRTDEDIARIFERPESSIADKATELCLAKDKAFLRKISGDETTTRMPRWSADEIETLTRLYPDHSNLEIAKILGRSVKSVVSKAHNIGLKKDPRRLQEMGRENVSLRYSRGEDGEEAEGASGGSSAQGASTTPEAGAEGGGAGSADAPRASSEGAAEAGGDEEPPRSQGAGA